MNVQDCGLAVMMNQGVFENAGVVQLSSWNMELEEHGKLYLELPNWKYR